MLFRSKIEIMFGRLKDWRRIATRYDRCAHTFMSAIAQATRLVSQLRRPSTQAGPFASSLLSRAA